ncbi:MAG: 30S ribosomal protein S4 [Candidatus Diapherotrites archaeon]|nr:30S ribosomal protein S4 [Candidatus Diapherotrites archaeon]
MGDPKKTTKKFEGPKKRWESATLAVERELKKKYGLKNKRELWKTKTMLRQKRETARKLIATPLEKRGDSQQKFIESLVRQGLLEPKATLDDVLGLTIEAFLERRLQTVAYRKGIANSAVQARQFITHGHIGVNGRKVSVPGYLVSREQENKVGFYGKEILKEAVQEKSKAALKKEFEAAKGETGENAPETEAAAGEVTENA